MNTDQALLTSWERQGQILTNLASLLTPELRLAKPSEDGWTLMRQLAHVANTRWYWLSQATGKESEARKPLFHQEGEEWVSTSDFDLILSQLSLSQQAISEWMTSALAAGTQSCGGYDHPVFFLQHMIWHEGYHAGLIMLGLRLAGAEPPEEWEEPNIWGLWRVENF